MSRIRNAVVVVAAVALVAAGMAVASTNSSAQRSADGVAYARAQLKPFLAVPTFKAPGPAFDASKAKGKLIFNIPVASYLPFVVNVGKAMQQVGAKLGVKVVDFPNQGQPSQWVQGMQQAIAQHANLIVLNTGADPRVLAPQIAQAKAAGIKVMVVHQYTATDPVPKSVVLSVPAPFVQVAKLLTYSAIDATNGKTDMLVLGDNNYESNRDMLKVMQGEIAAHCAGCKLRFVNVPVADWATKIQSSVQSAMVADPKLNFVVPIFDAMQQWTVPAILAAGASGRIQTASYNGDPAVITRIQQGKIVRATVGESADWLGYAYMDEALRILTGAKPIENLVTPVRVFVTQNAAQAGKPARWNAGYGSSYVQGYLKLWGMK